MAMSEDRHSLTIVIPALDEQEAIGSTVERCLAPRRHIREAGSVDEVEVIVVSDGSTDRTEEIARGYEEVAVLTFARNRGYGAAIKAGFDYGSGSLVGSWMNDSGFWIYAKMGGLTELESLKSWTPLLAVLGLSGLVTTLLLSRILPLT